MTAEREALIKCRDKFAEYVELHRAKLLPDRAPDEFYQNARTAHNAEVCEKVRRNQEMVDLCNEALANPATIRDTDEDAEMRLKEFAPTLYSLADQDIVPAILKPLLRDVADTIERLASSTPAEPREASGYCPFCMTADPVAPAEGDAPSALIEEAEFLCDRLMGLESELKDDEVAAEFYGHVNPSFVRLQALLSQRKAKPDVEGGE